ncbi:hypothetical protein [Pseudomonas paeninsulae]|uniref:hypothetical protein n=1 Tax=Pseudomonas paeninsulae TaxID=3110772 RepID=UPI002D76EFC9|nr:hypothetical protein [Pseudomonas sp. IT1137]
MQQLDTEYMLQEWGIWLRVQAGVPGYVSPTRALMRDNVQVERSPDPCITDELALLIDGKVCRLYTRYEDAGIALWNYYRHQGMSYRRLGLLMTKELGKTITHVRAQELVMIGSAWIDAAVCHYEEAA